MNTDNSLLYSELFVSNGGGKCGSFICAHNAVEKMKTEQEVDLYSTVVVARLRRPQFVGNLVRISQIRYIYQKNKFYFN